MTVVALDLSTNTGFAVFRDGELVRSGTLWSTQRVTDYEGPYPWSYVRCAEHVAEKIMKIVSDVIREDSPDMNAEQMTNLKLPQVVIEETTASRSNYDQKVLEFIHLTVITHLSYGFGIKEFSYVRDGVWKRAVQATQNADERRYNAKISRAKAKRAKEVAANTTLTAEQKEKLLKLPVKIDGKVSGKLTKKHYAVRAVRDIFGKELKQKDTNEADAILLGLAFVRGVPTCDGTEKGGLMPKSGTSETTDDQ